MNDAAPPTASGASRSAFNPWLFVAVAAIALAAWQWMETRMRLADTQQEVARRLADADDAAREERGARKQAEEQIVALQAKTGALEARLAEFQGQTATLQSIYQDISRSRDDATLFEVEQAVTLAGQQLQLAGDVPAAVLALQTADAKLARLDRPQFMPLRKALARDLEKLRSVSFVDLPGMSLKLEAILTGVDQFPLAMNQRPPAAQANAGGEVPRALPWWERVGGELWQEIRGLVRIQRFDRDEPVLLAPGQSFFLRENLKLRLLNARLAMLSRDQSTFRGELKAAQEWLARHFDGRDKAVVAALAGLRQLSASELNSEVPSLNDSLAALRAVRANKGGK